MRIICDFDGTLIDGRRQSFYAHKCASLAIEYAEGNIDDYWDMRRKGFIPYEYLKKLIRKHLTYRERRRYMREYLKQVESPKALSLMELFPETKEFIYHKDTPRFFLLSFRRKRELLEYQLHQHDLMWTVEDIVTCGKRSNWHNRADMKARSVPKWWLDAQDIYMIGDDYTDIVAAQMLDIKSVAVCSGIRNRDLLASFNPDEILNNIGEFWQNH